MKKKKINKYINKMIKIEQSWKVIWTKRNITLYFDTNIYGLQYFSNFLNMYSNMLIKLFFFPFNVYRFISFQIN